MKKEVLEFLKQLANDESEKEGGIPYYLKELFFRIALTPDEKKEIGFNEVLFSSDQVVHNICMSGKQHEIDLWEDAYRGLYEIYAGLEKDFLAGSRAQEAVTAMCEEVDRRLTRNKEEQAMKKDQVLTCIKNLSKKPTNKDLMDCIINIDHIIRRG
jgi:hypothetical protein